MKAEVRWINGRQFIAETESRQNIIIDGPVDHGGRGMGARPMELILAGLGSCSSFDVLDILEKGKQNVTGCKVVVTGERVDAVPAVFGDIHLEFVVTGHDLKETLVERAVNLSAEKYCSVAMMLGKGGVNITHSYQVVEG